MVLIDMDMPECCYDCPFYDDNGDYPTCSVNGHSRGYKFKVLEKRMSDCPLHESIIQKIINLTK